MIGVVIISHGNLASGVKSAIELLTGSQQAFEAVGLYAGDSPASFKRRVTTAIENVDDGSGVLALVDLFGGTPSNTISQLLDKDDLYAVAGVNLGMAIQAVFGRDEVSSPAELAQLAIQSAIDGLIDIRQKFVEASQEEDSEEDF